MQTRTSEVRFLQLSSARQQLLRLCQRLDHGRIEHLVVRGGEPCFHPVPRLIANRVGAPPRRQHALQDFVLKQTQVHLLELLTVVREGRIDRIEVINGLPTQIVVGASALAAEGGPHDQE